VLHYAARRFYAPVLLSVEDNDARLGLFITNDRPEVWQGEVRWSLQTVNGTVIEASYAPVVATPLATTAIRRLDFSTRLTLDNQRDLVVVCELRQDDQRLALTVTPFVPDKHLRLVDPALETHLELSEQHLIIQVRAEKLARFVELSLEGADVIFSDNYFHVPARDSVTVTCPVPADWTLDQARQALRVRSLIDSY
jgi:beta-mannosidase